MAQTTSKLYTNYTNISDIKSYWLDNVAKNYFDFDNINNYNMGIFGYVNEVMANTTEDAFNAVAVARNEFYPTTAQFQSSLYTMAALQSIDVPLTTPATCKCFLVLIESEVIDNSTYNDGVYELRIEDSLRIMADDMQFMLDYPIIIISKQSGIDSRGNPKYTHTIHYDIDVNNTLSPKSTTRYIQNKVIYDSGVSYLILFIDVVRQVKMVEVTKTVSKDSVLETVTMDVDFTGNLANFEVFYRDDPSSEAIQLKKIMVNGVTPSVPFVQYQLITQNKLRYTFSYNTVFVPKFNSEIITKIYTSEGADGNFESFSGDLHGIIDSNSGGSNMTILGRISGSSTGGKDQPSITEFKNKVVAAYSTNNTITTANDLQTFFDSISEDINGIKILFRKKRDDPLIRLFGAYAVMKDENENVVPTNTLELECKKSVVSGTTTAQRLSIQPGTVWEYKNSESFTLVPSVDEDGNLLNILTTTNSEDIYFTNPYLLAVNISPNNIGYYLNSISKAMSLEYTYVNDSSEIQFIASTITIYRNSISGSNYYSFNIAITPASSMQYGDIVELTDVNADDYEIRAAYNGKVIKEELYYDSEIDQSYIRYTIKYDTDNEDEKYLYVQASNTLPINHTSVTGYKMLFDVGDDIVAGDLIATKRVTDLGKLLIIGDLSSGDDTFYSKLRVNKFYTAFSIQSYDETTNVYTMSMYVATKDEIDLSGTFVLSDGVFDSSGRVSDNLAISMTNQIIELNVLYDNGQSNIGNKYSTYTGLNNFTLTNTYISSESDKFDFIKPLSYIKSMVEFYDVTQDPVDFTIVVDESPMIGAGWASVNDNFNQFIVSSANINDSLNKAFYLLENNFSIDSKFYNTYGKSRFFKVGNKNDNLYTLDNVRIKFHFGVNLNIISSAELFISQFRDYIKEYIESNERITTSGQDLYIFNLIYQLKAQFPEIQYIEYYGMNKYSYEAQKILGPDLTEYQKGFVPEFLNLEMVYDDNGEAYPNITIDIL